MLDVLAKILESIFNPQNLIYLREQHEKEQLAKIGADLFELLMMFEKVVFTGNRIIETLEDYIEDIVLRGHPPRSLALEGKRIIMLELIHMQILNIENIFDELNDRRAIKAYVPSEALRKLQEFIWMKKGPLLKLRRYFDDGYQFEKTAEYLSKEAMTLVREVDNAIVIFSKENWDEEKRSRIFSLFDLSGAKYRLNQIDAEIVNWRCHLREQFDIRKIIIEIHRRSSLLKP